MSDASVKPRRQCYFLLKEPGVPDRILILDTQELTIGRSEESDLQVEYAEVSRRHAMLQRNGGTYSVQNLSTSSSTTVNGNAVKCHTLSDQDVIRISQLEIVFVETSKNPATVGPRLEYASQLKDFALPGGAQGGNPEATILGVAHSDEEGAGGEFEVRPAGEFGYGLKALDEKSPVSRDLDLELDGFGLHDAPELVDMTPESLAPTARSVSRKPRVAKAESAAPDEVWTLDEEGGAPKASAPTLSLNLEIEGLTPDLRRIVSALVGKVISLPSLKIRLKGKDLG